jgi:hypothetical protein
VLLGATTPLTATVSGTTNTAILWSAGGVIGGDATVGTISSSGIFTAPQILPQPAAVNVQAASAADPTKTASVAIVIVSDVGVTLSPPNPAVELGAQQIFQAAIVSAGSPSSAVAWTLSGAGCSGAGCGAVSTSGIFTAPQILPSPAVVTLTATSVADPSRRAAAVIIVTSNFTFSVTGPSSLASGASAGFTATLTPAPNSSPSPEISWRLSGAGCSGAACGTIAVTGTGASATYTAPVAAPSPNVVSIAATPAADPSKSASLGLTITSVTSVGVSLAPASATLSLNHRQTFTAQVQNAANSAVTWEVNGAAGGSAVLGQVCVVGSSPCQAVTSANAGGIDYIAPSAVPSPNPVTLSVVSQADPTKSASSSITILPHVIVSVAPPSATLAPGASQAFAASVAGTSNQQVTWSISGAACSAAGAPCGNVDATGLYHAPAVAPSPNTLDIVATSSEDTSRAAIAAVTITVQPTILSLLSSSATAGAAGGFALRVDGGNFVPSSPGPGSAILVGGSIRSTVCDSDSDCSTPLSASDLSAAANLSISIQNPNGATSNIAEFVVAPAASGAGDVPLTPGAPSATEKDIIVVDLSTAGSPSPAEDVSLSIVALGAFQTSSNTCTLGGGPVKIARPASGQTTADVCAFSVSGLDPSYTYTLSGPSPSDIAVVGEAPLGWGSFI